MKINLKQAGMVAMASTLVMSSILSTPRLAEAKYLNVIEATDRLYSTGNLYSTIQDDIWFKAIFPNWNGDSKKIDQLMNFYENTFKGPAIPKEHSKDAYTKYDYLYEKEFITDPDHGYSESDIRGSVPNFNYAKLDPSKQYFPTLEFKVGSDIAYVDGKPFKLEAKVIRNKQGKVLVPMYHLASILSTGFGLAVDLDSWSNYKSGLVSLDGPLGVLRDMHIQVKSDGKLNIPSEKMMYGFNPQSIKPAPANHPAQGACVLNNTIYAPVAWLATATNAGKAEWNQAKQVAKINGQYHKEAVPYGIFKQAGTSSEYNIFKDWEMQPKQPVASKY